ncbi:serine hydrolase [Streptomyces xanthophaeus]|uniref:Beta-lactamase-related domain-containing protein n=1 Tax=Streptomyces xanthophaeus TaxID=67385 RepID=A0A919GS35_9ACTN|nr:serine hydrolase [Streptomyces xanthophaeus]GHI82890.1 hypothetical protein Sxan_02540 [Streptomyces xanthophaeus]
MHGSVSLCAAGGAVLAVLLTAAAGPQQARANGDDREKRSGGVLEQLVPSADGPGCAAAVGTRGDIAWEAGRGKADLGTGRAITPQTVFDMASNRPPGRVRSPWAS